MLESIRNKSTENHYWTENLGYLMDKDNLRSNELAKSIGLSPELIGKLKNGSATNPTIKTITKLCEYFKVSLEEFIFSDLSQGVIQNKVGFIPIIEWDNILNWRKNDVSEYTAIEGLKNLENMFALKINKDMGDFKEGTTLIVDTKAQYISDDIVLIYNQKKSIFYFKQLIIEEQIYLKSLVFELDSLTICDEKEQRIFGVVKGYQLVKFF